MICACRAMGLVWSWLATVDEKKKISRQIDKEILQVRILDKEILQVRILDKGILQVKILEKEDFAGQNTIQGE